MMLMLVIVFPLPSIHNQMGKMASFSVFSLLFFSCLVDGHLFSLALYDTVQCQSNEKIVLDEKQLYLYQRTILYNIGQRDTNLILGFPIDYSSSLSYNLAREREMEFTYRILRPILIYFLRPFVW